MRLDIDAAAVARMEAHAAAAYPDECCGALLGRAEPAAVVEAIPLPNATEEGPRRRFLVRPADYLGAEREAARRGLDLIGFYHSHPDHPARPSQTDLERAWPTLYYVIVSVVGGEPADVRAWRLADDRSGFVEVAVAAAGRSTRQTPA
jgi:proteasome lid subunit RPN8/RPN11